MPKPSPVPFAVNSPLHATGSPSTLGDQPITAAVALGRRDESLGELRRLLDGLGVPVLRALVHRRGATGSGRQHELAALLAELRAQHGTVTLVLDEALRPGELRRLADAVDAPVVDRTDVILRVFARRAQTRTARLEIELARLAYDLPRVRDLGGLNDRGGGGGRGERGHTGVELRKRRLRARQVELNRELATARRHAHAERERRQDVPAVALVGYTNAGKSSLMRALTGSDVLSKDQLFATLGTTVRTLADAPPPRVLVTDTVGFIRELPTELVASFHSTLEEARAADLLLLVVDAADPAWAEELAVTRATLATVGAGNVPALVVANKIDLVGTEQRQALAAALPDAILLSAHDGADVARLRAAVVAFFDQRQLDDVLLVPPAQGSLVAEVHDHVRVVDQHHDQAGAWLKVRGLPAALGRLRKRLTTSPPSPRTPAEMVALARRHGLDLKQASSVDQTGLDFMVATAADAQGVPYILRTPRRPEVIEAARIEARTLRLVTAHLPVAVPRWQIHAGDLIAYRRLDGTPVVTVTARGPQWHLPDPHDPPAAFIEAFATTLAALQRIPLHAAIYAGVPVRTIDAVKSELRAAIEAAQPALAPSPARYARWQAWLDSDDWPPHTALVHGDLHPGHLLIDHHGALTGVLDWTEAAVSDPSIDLALFYGAFGPAALDKLLPHFERAGGRTWPGLPEHVANRWSAFPAVLAAWALRTDNLPVLEHAKSLLAAGV